MTVRCGHARWIGGALRLDVVELSVKRCGGRASEEAVAVIFVLISTASCAGLKLVNKDDPSCST